MITNTSGISESAWVSVLIAPTLVRLEMRGMRVLVAAVALGQCPFDHIFKEEFCCHAEYAGECPGVDAECCAGFDQAGWAASRETAGATSW